MTTFHWLQQHSQSGTVLYYLFFLLPIITIGALKIIVTRENMTIKRKWRENSQLESGHHL